MWKGAPLINTRASKMSVKSWEKKRPTDTILGRCGPRPHATGLQRLRGETRCFLCLNTRLIFNVPTNLQSDFPKKLECSPTCKQERNELICTSLNALLWLQSVWFWPDKTLILSNYVTATNMWTENTGPGSYLWIYCIKWSFKNKSKEFKKLTV